MIPLFNTWSTLDRHSINTSVDTWWTLHRHLSQQSTNFRLMHVSCLTLGTDYWPTDDQVSIKCRPSINWVVDEVLIKGIDWHSTVDTFNTQDPYIFSIKGMRARIIITPMPQFNVLACSMTSTIFITGKYPTFSKAFFHTNWPHTSMLTFLSPWRHPTTPTNSILACATGVKWGRGEGGGSSDGSGWFTPKTVH